MDSDQAASEPCPVCGKRRKYAVGRLCTACFSRLRVSLTSLPLLAAEVATRVEPASARGGVGRSAPGSRPPLNLDAVDPALALIELVKGDPSSRVPLLEALESWERAVRADNGLVPYGVATSTHRDPLSTTATLTNVVRFLGVWLEWMADSVTIDIADFDWHVSAARRVLRRWSWEDDPRPRWRVPCPTERVAGTCASVLDFEGLEDEEVACRACGRRWSATRLLLVASTVDTAAVWVDAEAAGVAVGVDASTVRRWARSGRVQRRGQRYNLADIRGCADTRRTTA